MAYGKYNRQPTIMTPSNPEAMFTNYQNYGLLGALANELISNYNARGIKKGTAEAETALANMGKAEVSPELQQAYDLQNNNAEVSMNQGLGVNPNKDTRQQAIENQRSQLPTLNYNGGEPTAPSPQLTKQYFDMNGNQTANATTPQATQLQPQQRDLAAEKLDYAVQKYANSDNPAGDKRIIQGDVASGKQFIDSVPVGKLADYDPETAALQIRAQLRKNGRSDYQIDQIMQNIAPNLMAKDKEWKAAKSDELLAQYQAAVDTGNLQAQTEAVGKMAKVDPTRAAFLSRNLDRAWKNYNMVQDIQDKKKLYQEQGHLNEEQARNMAVFGSIYNPAEIPYNGGVGKGVLSSNYSGGAPRVGKNTSGNWGSYNDRKKGSVKMPKLGIDTPEYKFAQDFVKKYEEKLENGWQPTKAEQGQYNDWKRLMTKSERYSSGHDTTNDDIIDDVDYYINKGGHPEDILAHLANNGATNGQLEVAIRRMQDLGNALRSNDEYGDGVDTYNEPGAFEAAENQDKLKTQRNIAAVDLRERLMPEEDDAVRIFTDNKNDDNQLTGLAKYIQEHVSD